MSANQYIFIARYLQGWNRHYFWHYFQCSSYTSYSWKLFSFILCGIIIHLQWCLSASINLQKAIQTAESLWTGYQTHAGKLSPPHNFMLSDCHLQLGRALALHGGGDLCSWLAMSPQSSFPAVSDKREQPELGNTRQKNLPKPVILFTSSSSYHICVSQVNRAMSYIC